MRIVLRETESGSLRVTGGWVTVRGEHYPLRYELQPGQGIEGWSFETLLTGAKAGRFLDIDSDGQLRWEDAL